MYVEKKVKKSGAVKKCDFQFDIKHVPFSRKLSLLNVYEKVVPTERGDERKQLLLSRTLKRYDSAGDTRRGSDLIAMRPMYDGMSIPYVCVTTPSMLEVDTEYGYIQFTFENKDLLRVRGKGIGMRLFSKMLPHEACVPRLDGTHQIVYDVIGEVLFVPIKGELDFDTEWKWKRVGSDDVTVEVIPDQDGEFELALHYSVECDTERLPAYPPFEECVADAQKDYEAWFAMYPAVPGKYEDLKKLAVYCIWICYVAPTGILKDNVVLFSKDNSAFSWHQAYHAMAITNDVDTSVQIMRSYFDYQDEYGEIPDLVDDQYVNILATKPPFHGFAVLQMLKHMGDKMTEQHCLTLYEPLAKWYTWWMTLRDTDNDGIPQYNQACESGNDFSMMMSKGTPVEAPDLMTYIILLGEALGKLAEKLGKAEEAKEWFTRSQKMLDTLISDFWDGEKFIARHSGSHLIVDFDETEAYVPILLGKRLPQNIIDKLTETLADPEKYYTPIGFRSSPKQYKDGVHVPSYIGDFGQVRLIPGLYEAGKKELARDALIGFCDANLKYLPNFGYLEFYPPEDPMRPGGVNLRTFGLCSALSSAIFISLAGFLAEISKESELNV